MAIMQKMGTEEPLRQSPLEAADAVKTGSEMLHAEIFRTGALYALLTGKHMLKVGPPGHGKTRLSEELFQALDLEEEQTCVISGYKGAGEEILLNYLHPGKLERGQYEYLPGKSLLNTKLAYVDEVGALSRVAQQALLQIMQSRRFSRAGIDLKLPLDCLFAGGNSAPEDPAVRDRFAIQIPVELPEGAMGNLLEWTPAMQRPKSISWQALQQLRKAVKRATLSKTAHKLGVELAKKFEMSPRRVVEALVPVSKAEAVLHGVLAAEAHHMEAAAPYVVMHTGELTLERFQQVQEELQAQQKRVQAVTQIARWEKTLGEVWEEDVEPLTKLQKLAKLRKELPNPDGWRDADLAKSLQEVVTILEQRQKYLARELEIL